MTRTKFHQGLDDLRSKLLAMGGMAELAVDRATEAYRKRDPKLCQAVFDGEKTINEIEREIDELALDLLAMQQPMAVDLRFITAVMKINADLERVGDQAVNIAERALAIVKQPDVELPVDIPRMAATVSGMVRRALESFLDGKAELAEAVLTMDDIVDRMNKENYVLLAEKMRKDPAIIGPALNALLVSRNLERVADHATNIAEDVIFWIKGADVRHHSAEAAGDTGTGPRLA
ncbi:MAG TPA: phosphate signaling complex protein PhoU [Terriglobales bacterium]|nr:phosphate signaling complex protein PhoU [Terriglobales bacterium]